MPGGEAAPALQQVAVQVEGEPGEDATQVIAQLLQADLPSPGQYPHSQQHRPVAAGDADAGRRGGARAAAGGRAGGGRARRGRHAGHRAAAAGRPALARSVPTLTTT
ncbi:hypothetical protein PYW07_004629 [Mythimna separata]|nr:hypothetical protein PYW07_004625 [Mythimna separata]KAJ8731462.1 hypothetical protein PYW07_004626 [Mythimna separata]KAJ8731463.1 hypothetical protein PYW07_004627 [Mythimna separata]KAJ8731464.1 hypothetical protein PYW07_004628 [Mythimna separata]KAJ8731465.1 hypothetical protein PYW07_004629 [Mythimna separata]